MRALALASLLLLIIQPACSSTSIGDPGGALNGGPGTGFNPEAPGAVGADTGGGGIITGRRDAIGSAADYYGAGGEGRADLDNAVDGSAEPTTDAGAPDPGALPIDGDVAPTDAGDDVAPEVVEDAPADALPAEVSDGGGADGTDPGTALDDTTEADIAEDTGPPAEDTAPDQGPPAEDVAEDTSADVPFSWPENAPPPQCRRNSDCQTGICSRAAPGGICMGCGVAADCPADHDCNYGGCNLWCSSDDECPVAMRCHPTHGDCVLKSCEADADCDGPYVCDSGKCRRPLCGDEGLCPEPLTCEDGVCVEP